MKRRSAEKQKTLWIAPNEFASSPGHPFYERLNKVFRDAEFDRFAEGRCEPYYASQGGRPSIPPGVYFRMLLIGYFERIDSERGICWRCADSLSLRNFLGLALDESVPDHSTLSRIRSRLPLEVHQEIFGWVLQTLSSCGLIDGKTLGVDATTLEANAALRSIVRRDTGEGYTTFLEGLAQESGIKEPTRSDLAKLDRKRPKKGSNAEWVHPEDPDAQIMKMKDGRTHLAHKAEHAVDMSGTGAILSVTLHGGATGDTHSLPATLESAQERLGHIEARSDSCDAVHPCAGSEIVADKGYHSNQTLTDLSQQGYRTYISEPDRGRRNWKNAADARCATYGNRRRIRGERGKQLLRDRGELLERPFAHYLGSGGMRRTHLRGHENILKRLLIHVAGFNLGILMRDLIGSGTPKELAATRAALQRLLVAIFGLQVGDHLAAALCLEILQRHQRDQIVALLVCCQLDPTRQAPAAVPKSTGC